MADTTVTVIRELIDRMQKKPACFSAVRSELFEALRLAEQDYMIIVQLAIRPPVQITFDAGPEKLDAIKN